MQTWLVCFQLSAASARNVETCCTIITDSHTSNTPAVVWVVSSRGGTTSSWPLLPLRTSVCTRLLLWPFPWSVPSAGCCCCCSCCSSLARAIARGRDTTFLCARGHHPSSGRCPCCREANLHLLMLLLLLLLLLVVLLLLEQWALDAMRS